MSAEKIIFNVPAGHELLEHHEVVQRGDLCLGRAMFIRGLGKWSTVSNSIGMVVSRSMMLNENILAFCRERSAKEPEQEVWLGEWEDET